MEILTNIDEKNYAFWLRDAKHLTIALKKYYSEITLTKYSQELEDLNSFERNLLNKDNSIVRKISLNSDEKELVYARTIVPVDTYIFFKERFESLGENPIGESFLYNNDNFLRSDFIVRKLSNKEFQQETSRSVTNDYIFSRSSIFSLKEQNNLKVLITEYFLGIKNLVEKRSLNVK
ncbi:chorismate--pyruvate lyase family protein [Pseudofrancisella aestuarii]|uniref:Chorismate--pyruvate lyase family protein n=1 Tax=Pseudofrancisella aestuarii TaxID=2670347 RepID=A0ABV9TD89_9GAMM|nr:chorismate lyase [Pseudofrancisella aestuarii]